MRRFENLGFVSKSPLPNLAELMDMRNPPEIPGKFFALRGGNFKCRRASEPQL